jgi:hypothetical protein
VVVFNIGGGAFNFGSEHPMIDGWIYLWRCSTDNHLYFLEPFTKWQAWQDMLLLAAFKPHGKPIRGITVELQRGQLAASDRYLARRWKWSVGKVRRFLRHLESKSVAQIVSQTNNVSRVITITNYEWYQKDGITNESTGGITDGAQTKHKRNKEKEGITKGEEKETKEGKKKKDGYRTRNGKILSGEKLEDFNTFWSAYGFPKGKAGAADSWLNLKDYSPELVEAIIAGAKRECSRRQDLIDRGLTPKFAQGWLTDRRWEDEDGHSSSEPSTAQLAAEQLIREREAKKNGGER